MEVSVSQGQIPVSSIHLLVDNESAKVLLIDCDAKRFDVYAMSSSENNEIELSLVKAPDTLYATDTDNYTTVAISGLSDDWQVEVSQARYSVMCFLYKTENKYRVLYEKER